MDWELDDLKYMEDSAFHTFVDESQKDVLLLLWYLRERPDNAAFERSFGPAAEENE